MRMSKIGTNQTISLKDHIHPNMNCGCVTGVPITHDWWGVGNIEEITPLYLTKDGMGVTSIKPTNKKEKKEMERKYSRSELYVGSDYPYVSVRGDGDLYLTTDGEIKRWLKGANNDNIYYSSYKEAEEAIDKYLGESGGLGLWYKGFHSDTDYGSVGEPTLMTDLRGEPLFVGDVVELFSTSDYSCGSQLIVEDYEKSFVMGAKGFEWENGFATSGGSNIYAILKSKSHKELKAGDGVGGLCVIETKTKELTIAEIEAKLGYKIKVVGND